MRQILGGPAGQAGAEGAVRRLAELLLAVLGQEPSAHLVEPRRPLPNAGPKIVPQQPFTVKAKPPQPPRKQGSHNRFVVLVNSCGGKSGPACQRKTGAGGVAAEAPPYWV